ncbi:MAG TPA: esterase-like activity of phytase family protein [Allosphingosinicella sp.]
MRIILLLAAWPFLGTFAPLSLQKEMPAPPVSRVAFQPVPLNESAPGQKRLSELLYLGGWSLTSNDRRFGGISAIHVEGDEALAAGDAGWLARFPVALGGVVGAEIRAIGSGPGDPSEKSDRDIEAMVVRGNRAWIAFEQANAVWRYALPGWRAQSSAVPPAMRQWEANSGPEAMVRLADGRFIVFSEGGGGDSEAVLFSGDPAVPGTKATKLRYRPPEGYRITDAAVLPDGRLLFLNRDFSLFGGFSAKLTLGALPPLREGALLTGVEIADFKRPVITDNLEALSVTQDPSGTIVWIASDDNYTALQRTLLLKFRLLV